MSKLEHAFDPALSMQFTRHLSDAALPKAINPPAGRDLFYQLNQPGQYLDIMANAYDFVAQALKDAEQVYASLIIQDYDVEKLASLQTTKIAPLPEPLLNQDNLYACVNQTAAILFTQPCWLQNIAQTASSQTVAAVQLVSVYLQLTQGGRADLLATYRSLLLATGVRIPTLYSVSYSKKSEIMPEMFDFGAIQLALARFPRVLFPEILGFTLAYCQLPTLIEVCFPKHQLPALFFKLRQYRVQEQLAPLLDCITGYLDLFPGQKQALWQRIQKGFWLYQLQMQRCRDQIKQLLEKPLSPQQAIARLFQQKAAAAIGHHQQIQLQGTSLDKWFAGMPANNQEFLQALKQSGYVDRQKPAESPLLKLFDFKGPMFGVLDESEQLVLQNWLQNGLNEAPTSIVKEVEKPVTTTRPSASIQPLKKYTKLSNKELYYYLVNADLFPDVLPIAKGKARKLLQACAFFNPLPFKHYSHEQFAAYIENIYQREISAYQPLQGKPKISREAYVWGLEQIAPMILIDGCWLQNSLALQNVSPDICEILFSIYCDEIGNGRLEQNHPHIFQRLLDSLSIKVPPVYSVEFVEHPGFINSAFDLPVYMLSLSSFSAEFLPELLGLNMAIELSGLGKGYMRLVDEWNYWGIDSTIASIHISIDNYASGHTFLAKKAIQLYLDELMQRTGDHAMLARHWRRVYNGYASLRFVGGRFRLGLPVWYLVHKFKNKYG